MRKLRGFGLTVGISSGQILIVDDEAHLETLEGRLTSPTVLAFSRVPALSALSQVACLANVTGFVFLSPCQYSHLAAMVNYWGIGHPRRLP